MARGWGRSEEDQAADKEHAGSNRPADGKSREEALLESKRRSLKLSLARVEDLLAKTTSGPRRQALETARAELLERLETLVPPAGRG
jgi:hypothetical protein